MFTYYRLSTVAGVCQEAVVLSHSHTDVMKRAVCGLCCVWPVSVMAISMTACSSWCGGHEGPAARRLVAGDILNDGVKCQTASGILVPFRMIS